MKKLLYIVLVACLGCSGVAHAWTLPEMPKMEMPSLPSIGVLDQLMGKSIHQLAAKGDMTGINKIIAKEGKDVVNSRDDLGNTPILMAAYGGQSLTLKFLQDKGGDISLVNKSGSTVVHAAAYGQQWAMFYALKREHPKLSKKTDYDQVTPYMIAALKGGETGLFKSLSSKIFFARDADGGDLLSWAVGGGNDGVVNLYFSRVGRHLDVKMIRKAYLANFDNPASKSSLSMLARSFCGYARNHKKFRPTSLDVMKFGRQCDYNLDALSKKRSR